MYIIMINYYNLLSLLNGDLNIPYGSYYNSDLSDIRESGWDLDNPIAPWPMRKIHGEFQDPTMELLDPYFSPYVQGIFRINGR